MRHLRRGLERDVDVASLAAFRILFGGLLFVAVVRTWVKGTIFDAFVAPKFFFTYWGLAWLRPLPGEGMYVVYAVMGIAALAFAAGIFYRASAIALFTLFTYAHLCDVTNYLNHYYLVSLLLLLSCFLPLHAAFSIDARLRPAARRSTVPAWMLWLLRFQIGVVYFFGGVAKLKADWLLRAMPLKIWLLAAGDFPLLAPLFRLPATPYVMSWLGAAFDLSAAFLLATRRTRPYAYAVVCVFHVVTARLFQIGMFPWIMIASSLVFFDPSWPRRILARLRGRAFALPAPSRAPLGRAPRVALAYVVVQLLLPLRHVVYPGNVLWTEEGYRFAWNVMLVEKTGSAEITLRDPVTGASRQPRVRDTLTPLQVKMMATQPDMILAFARHLADEAERRGEARPMVFADVVVVMGGRPPARLVDPAVDLAREREGLGAKRWLLPAPP
ncbi:MAG: HTTM domain-containing protein [Labilithrix sp.]|nr:HTTM domain-containing protein [Labilithrix sp.]